MLYALPDKIRYDSIVMAFVRATSEDQKTYPGKQAYPDRHNGTMPKADVPHRYGDNYCMVPEGLASYSLGRHLQAEVTCTS